MQGISKKAILVSIILFYIFLATGVSAEDYAQSIFNEANKLFLEKKHEKAVINYEKLIKMGYEDPSVYFNLSNAYMSLGMPAKAVLNLHRAKKLQPRGKDILHNLSTIQNIIKEDISYKEKKEHYTLKKFIRSFDFLSRSETAAFILVFYLIFFIWYIVRRFIKKYKLKIIAGSIGIVSYLLTFFMIFLFIGTVYLDCYYPKMVVMKKAEMMSAPKAEVAYIMGIRLKEGIVVELEDTYKGWGNVKIETGGKSGWVKLEALEEI